MEQVIQLTDFATDTLEGLTAVPKYLSSKYFYDKRGSKIFQDIMHMPEYYLTDCELEIFKTQKQDILNDFAGEKIKFELVELGAGDGLKTKILLSHFLNCKADFKYTPVDISGEAVKNLVADLNYEIPGLQVNGRIGDYFELIRDFNVNGQAKRIILFLGSNIGNFNEQKSLDFLNRLRMVLNPQDQIFIGFDLKKDPEVILRAYNDPHGYTASFNLNLLRRINDELNGNFELLKFKHHEVYDPQNGTARSFLVSREKQSVFIGTLNKTIHFEKWETVFTEMSQKYDLQMINLLAEKSGFEVVRNYFDKRLYFVNSLWKLKG